MKYANYTAVKDAAILKMQKTLHDEVIASVREEELVDMEDSKPIRKWSANTDKKAEEQENLQYQDEYKIEFEMWANECRTFKRDMKKAYAHSYDYCTEAMKRRIEENPKFKEEVLDDPIKLLKEIAKAMHQPVRSSYPYEVVAEGLQRIVNMKQYKKENLVQYTERFKHEKSVIKTILGTNFLDKFVESTKEFQDLSDDKEKKKLKAEAFEKWMAVLYIKNSDQRKYGSCLLYTSPSPRDKRQYRMPSSA